MEPTTAVTVAAEVAKAADKIPFTSLMKAMLGPASDELALRWQDSVRAYRYGNQLKLLKKAEKMAKDAGFTPKAVPIKLLFPLLEGASLEENEDLHTMWAALLANSSNPEAPNLVHPSFAGTLKQLGSEDAGLLAVIHGWWRKEREEKRTTTHTPDLLGQESAISLSVFLKTWESVAQRRNPSKAVSLDEVVIKLNHLQALFLIERRHDLILASSNNSDGVFYSLTQRGYDFIEACQPPAPKK